MPPIKALLFDLDGTLTHTDPIHLRAMQALLELEGIALDEDGYRTHVSGRPNSDVGRHFFPERSVEEHRAFIDRKEARFREIAGELVPLAGAVALIDQARADGLGIALVTNAPRKNVSYMLEGLKIADRFDALVYGDEMERGKPDPLPYLTALETFGLGADEALAFEDSVPGLTAAKRAGLFTVGITSSLERQVLVSAGADLVVKDFEDEAILDLHRTHEWRHPLR